jgi:hypothetical protein
VNARTGEFTPPGVTALARSNQASLAAVVGGIVAEVTGSLSRRRARDPHSVRTGVPRMWVGAQATRA